MRTTLFWGTILAMTIAVTNTHASVFNPHVTTLDNGLTVIVVPSASGPVVSHMLWYKVGAADERDGETGLAHYLEHLMFKSTKTLKAGEFSKVVAALGGEDNAFTSYDYTAYFQQIASAELPRMMTMEAGRMNDLLLKDDEVLTERDVVLRERALRTDDDPAARLGETVQASLFVHHPYGRPVIGWGHEVEKLSVQQARDFYRRWYGPNNAVLVVSGDVTPDAVVALAQNTYGKIPTFQAPARVRAADPVLTADRRVVVKDKDVQQPQWQRHYRVTPWRDDKEHSYAMEVLGEYLNNPAGPLVDQLVRQQKVMVDIAADYDGRNLDDGTFSFTFVPADNITMHAAEDAFEKLLADLAQKGVAAADVTAAIQRLQRNAVFARDSLMAPGYAFGLALTTGRTVADVEQWPARIGAVTPDQVNAALRQLVANPSFVTGELLPASLSPTVH
ncbi:MAG: insulinase family protein [Alphaproteobacteria bacterium]|nr:insulinase family protein [Alphaproteobacteria bacterium]